MANHHQIKFTKSFFDAQVNGKFTKLSDLQEEVLKLTQLDFLNRDDFYLVHNGKVLREDDQVENALSGSGVFHTIHVAPRLFGGKGGFGSMLRAIGAQIEKTTNRDACRDLSGRRLRDINEEQRLKKWFAKQAEREQEKQEARKRKLEKLRIVADGPPLPKIDDQEYLQKREDIVEAVFEAVDEAFRGGSAEREAVGFSKAAASSSTNPENSSESDSNESDITPSASGTSTEVIASSSSSQTSIKSSQEVVQKTFKRTMFEEDMDSASSSDESEEDAESPSKIAKLA